MRLNRIHSSAILFLVIIALAAAMPQVAQAASWPSHGDTGCARMAFEPSITKIGALAPGALGLPGERVVWTITASNHGDMAGTDVMITDTVRAELRIDEIVMPHGSFQQDGQTIIFVLPVLNPGESVEMQVITTVLRSPANGLLINQVSLVASGPGGELIGTARAELSVPTGLPATGYPPEFPGDGEPPVWVFGLGAFTLVATTALIVWRRGSRTGLTVK